MIDSSPIDTKQNAQIEAAQEWLHDNGNNVSGIEQKLGLGGDDPERFQAPTMTITRKTRNKDDGPLEIVCRWIVENQIGKGQHRKDFQPPLTML